MKQTTGWSSYLWMKQSKQLAEHHTCKWNKANNRLNIIPANETKQTIGWTSYLWMKETIGWTSYLWMKQSKHLADHHACEWNKANNWLIIMPVNETKQTIGWTSYLWMKQSKQLADHHACEWNKANDRLVYRVTTTWVQDLCLKLFSTVF